MPIEVVVFDLDDTLVHEGFHDEYPILCDDTLQVLDLLKGKNIKMAIATHNDNAEIMLKNSGIYDYFAVVQAYCDYTDKRSHMRKISESLNVKLENMAFFDDLPENIEAVRRLGVLAIQVSHISGITLAKVGEILGDP